MSEARTIYDPFLNKYVEIGTRLTDRLRGRYAIGPTMPNGEPEFGWREFPSPPIQKEAADEIDRLNAWAQGFSDAQLKERRLGEELIQEMQRHIDKLKLSLVMIREGCAEPAKFAGERLAALSAAGQRREGGE